MSAARARYAGLLAASPGVDDPRVIQAFATVPREQFVGPGPWLFLGDDGYTPSVSADPTLVYDDVVVALAPDKRINNGQPSLHARCLSAARIHPGDRVLHIGCGTGYYSAVLSELVGAAGTVTAWDIEPGLVDSARRNLRPWPNVSVSLRDATRGPIPESDVVYVCAGCTQPLRAWVDGLSEGGRLLFPLTPGWDYGGMLMVTRAGRRYQARFICKCSFIPCVGGSNPAAVGTLAGAFAGQGMERVSTLHFGVAPPQTGAWVAGDSWWLGQ